MISGFSVLSALVVYSAALAAVCIMRRKTGFLKRGGTSVLLMASIFATLRLLLPFEMPAAYAARSWAVLGVPLRFFRTYQPVTRALALIWAVGGVVVTGKYIFDLYRARKQCRNYAVVENRLVQEIARRCSVPCPVLVSPDVNVPYVAGIFHYNIYVPALELSEKEIELILAHESQHVRSHDALTKLLFGVMSAVVWWNPIAHWSRREIGALLELRCDAKVTEGMDELGRYEYADMLKNMAKRVVSGRRMSLSLDESMAVSRSSLLNQRIRVLAERGSRRPRRRDIVVQFVVLTLLFCASYLLVVQSAIAPPTKSFVDETGVYYKENYDGPVLNEGPGCTFIVKTSDGRYQLCINYRFNRYLTVDEVESDQYKGIFIIEEGREG